MFFTSDNTDQLFGMGGKAYNLSRLSKITNVPEFIVLKICHEEFIEKRKEIDVKLKSYLRKDKLYAVRSSADVEDGETNAYAGMFETLLNIEADNVYEAVGRILQSANSDRVKQYIKTTHKKHVVPKISVVVQEMIEADTSGVALSYYPSDKSLILVEAIYGLGELLVSGQEEPDRWLIGRHNNEIEKYLGGRQVTKLTKNGRIMLPPIQQITQKLNSDQISHVISLLKLIENELLISPLDLEFCFVNKKLYALQARPLTSKVNNK